MAHPKIAAHESLLREHTALNITKKCNQNCIFCFEGDRASWTEPSYDDVCDMLAVAATHAKNVIFMGAEALLRRDILEIVEHSRGLGLEVSIFTNGLALARDGFVSQLAESGVTGLQISAHYADAESFARGAQRPPKHFERFLVGLENVRQHNKNNPDKQISTFPKTSLFTHNYKKIHRIVSLLDDHLGESFKGYMLGCLSPCDTKTDDDLLEPFEGRREELASLIEMWDCKKQLSFSKVPLCLIRPHEHLSLDVGIIAKNLSIVANFDEKSSIQEMHDYQSSHDNNPYRWLCSTCNLSPICPPDRWSWDHPSYRPNWTQAFTPEKTRTVSDVIKKLGIEGVECQELSPDASGENHRYPENRIIDLLTRRSSISLPVRNIGCIENPLFSIELKLDQKPAFLHLGLWTKDTRSGYPVSCFRLKFNHVESRPWNSTEIARALLWLSVLDDWDWRTLEGNHWYDSYWGRLSSRAYQALFKELCSELPSSTKWLAGEASLTDDGAVQIPLSHAAGYVVTISCYPQFNGRITPKRKNLKLLARLSDLHFYCDLGEKQNQRELALAFAELGDFIMGVIPLDAHDTSVSKLLVTASHLSKLKGR